LGRNSAKQFVTAKRIAVPKNDSAGSDGTKGRPDYAHTVASGGEGVIRHEDVVVCLLEDGVTKAEVHLLAAGRDELVRMQRDALQRVMEAELVAAVERLTERKVVKFLSGTNTLADASVELFVLEPRGPNRTDGGR
jgi:uncharacterized protein YbcI